MNDAARHLRLIQTEVEKRLWYRLRNRQIDGAKFRRQAQVGCYNVVFACFEQRLLIELDGGQHASVTERDRQRTQWLNSQGYSILRFWNNDVIENMDGVLERIAEELKGGQRPPTPLTPALSRKGRGS